jgi:hypothetical protein
VATGRKSARLLVAPVGSALSSPLVVADVQADGQDTRCGTHRAEEGDLAEYSLESVDVDNMDRLQVQRIPQMAEAQGRQ